jgi:WD40 repeat protein
VEPVTCVAFSPDSRTLATGSRLDGTVRLWDVRAASARRVLAVATSGGASMPSGDAGPTSLGWTADGSTLAVGTARGTVELWDAAAGVRAATLAAGDRPTPLSSVAFRPHGSTLAAATAGEGSARVFRMQHTASPATEVRLASSEPAAVEQVAWSRDGRVLAVAGDGLLLARARDGATLALHAFVDDAGRPQWIVETDDGHVDGDADALDGADLPRRPGVLRDFVAGR